MMSAPRKNFNYYAPYGQNVLQYPSQTADYLTQHAGGQQASRNPQQDDNQRSGQNTPHFYQTQMPQRQNVGFYEDWQSSSANPPRFFHNNTPYKQGHRRGFGQRSGKRGHQHQQNQYDNSSYFHNSMLEDPWRELMERHNAIHGSVMAQQSTEFDV